MPSWRVVLLPGLSNFLYLIFSLSPQFLYLNISLCQSKCLYGKVSFVLPKSVKSTVSWRPPEMIVSWLLPFSDADILSPMFVWSWIFLDCPDCCDSFGKPEAVALNLENRKECRLHNYLLTAGFWESNLLESDNAFSTVFLLFLCMYHLQ